MNLNNPYILLRILIACDVLLFIVSVIIPGFKDESLIDYIISTYRAGFEEAFFNYLWLFGVVITIISWMLLLMASRIGRILYLFPIPISMITVYMYGNYSHGPGILDVLVGIYGIYYGFVISMIYFGPVSYLFKIKLAQQGDAPECRT